MESHNIRLRKNKSSSKSIMEKPDEVKKFLFDKPIHRPSESLLSEPLEMNNIPGFVIWVALFLSAVVGCLLLDNLRSGIRINPEKWLYYLTGGLESLLIYMLLYLVVPATVCLFLEKCLADNKIPEKIGITAHILNISQLVILPGVFTYSNSTFSAEKDSLVQYPDNLTFKDMAYFFWAPTICYELNFPRNNSIRKRFLLKRLLEVILLILLILCLCEQWLAQSMRNALLTYTNIEDLLKKIEFDLKLSIPTHLLWLAWFYGFFHSWLNFLAELMYFADRTFYLDWWNSINLGIYWTKWNIPVTRWCRRHIYLPLRELGYSRNVGLCAVFIVSGFFHEYLFSVPLRINESLTFIGWLLQIPLIHLSTWIERRCGSMCGIITVAIFYVFGPAKLLLTYYHKYLITHCGESTTDSYATI